MKIMTKHVVAVIAFACIVAPASAFAQSQGIPEGRTDSPSTAHPAQVRESAQDRAATARASVEERRAVITQQVEEHRAQVKADVCERRQERLTEVIPRLSQEAISIKSTLDTAYERVASFYESGQLTVTDYGTYVEEIEVAKANSEMSIDLIEDQAFTLDCENPRVAEQLDGYRLAVSETRDALKQYRKSLVELIGAMRAAASLDQPEDTNGNNSVGTEEDDNE